MYGCSFYYKNTIAFVVRSVAYMIKELVKCYEMFDRYCSKHYRNRHTILLLPFRVCRYLIATELGKTKAETPHFHHCRHLRMPLISGAFCRLHFFISFPFSNWPVKAQSLPTSLKILVTTIDQLFLFPFSLTCHTAGPTPTGI